MSDHLPASVAPDVNIGESKRELAGKIFVSSFDILDSGDNRRVAVNGDFHFFVAEDFRLQISRSEIGDVGFSRYEVAVQGDNVEFFGVKFSRNATSRLIRAIAQSF